MKDEPLTGRCQGCGTRDCPVWPVMLWDELRSLCRRCRARLRSRSRYRKAPLSRAEAERRRLLTE
jgi:hypothetical protein